MTNYRVSGQWMDQCMSRPLRKGKPVRINELEDLDYL